LTAYYANIFSKIQGIFRDFLPEISRNFRAFRVKDFFAERGKCGI
jgi:hypothetical protein